MSLQAPPLLLSNEQVLATAPDIRFGTGMFFDDTNMTSKGYFSSEYLALGSDAYQIALRFAKYLQMKQRIAHSKTSTGSPSERLKSLSFGRCNLLNRLTVDMLSKQVRSYGIYS